MQIARDMDTGWCRMQVNTRRTTDFPVTSREADSSLLNYSTICGPGRHLPINVSFSRMRR